MCQIISLRAENAVQIANYMKPMVISNLIEHLNIKGGDDYSVSLLYIGEKEYVYRFKTANDLEMFLYKWSTVVNFDHLKERDSNMEYSKFEMILFSRQTPETELDSDNVESAPYFNGERMVWMHGIIGNEKEIAAKYNIDHNVDSELVLYAGDKYDLKDLQGWHIDVIYDRSHNDYSLWYNHGMPFWKHVDCKHGVTIYTTQSMIGTQFAELAFNGTEREYNGLDVNCDMAKKEIFVAYSGGMDIALSLYEYIYSNISKNKDVEYNLNFIYFDYGSNATEYEIKSLDKMINLLKNDEFISKNIITNKQVLNVENIIAGFAKLNNTVLKLTDNNAVGNELETEVCLSYVPYRNSLFMEIIGSIIDSRNIETCDILIGLNLSEMQVYGDNGHAWREHMEQVIRYGGKYPKHVNIIAPYNYKTKTNMIFDFIRKYGHDTFEKILKTTYSCYYPDKDGKPCGKCGSCLLRKKAIERSYKNKENS